MAPHRARLSLASGGPSYLWRPLLPLAAPTSGGPSYLWWPLVQVKGSESSAHVAAKQKLLAAADAVGIGVNPQVSDCYLEAIKGMKPER